MSLFPAPRAGWACCKGASGERKAKGGSPGSDLGSSARYVIRVVEDVTLARVFFLFAQDTGLSLRMMEVLLRLG